MKKSYPIEIDCVNCANKVEAAVQKVPGVKALNINFMAQKMTVEFEPDVNTAQVLREILRVGQRIESDFSIEGV